MHDFVNRINCICELFRESGFKGFYLSLAALLGHMCVYNVGSSLRPRHGFWDLEGWFSS